MFNDNSANRPRLSSVLKGVVVAATFMLLAPFVLLAFAPMLVLFLPVAVVASPILLAVLASGGHANQQQARLALDLEAAAARVELVQEAPA